MTTAILVTLLTLGVLFALARAGQKPPRMPTWLTILACIYALAAIALWVTYGFLTGEWLVVATVLVPLAVGVCVAVGSTAVKP